MGFLKSEKWKLKTSLEYFCLVTTIFYGAIIVLYGLLYLIMFLSPYASLENNPFGGMIFMLLMLIYIVLYYSKLIYILPVAISIFLIFFAIGESIEKKDLRICIHPLILSSIATSVTGSVLLLKLIESAF